MEALIILFRITYLFWPLILLFGIRSLFRKNLPLLERIRMAIQKVFLGWLFMALSLGVILLNDRQPFIFFTRQVNDLLFGGLGLVTGSITIIWTIHRWRSSRINLKYTRTLDGLMALSPREFEKLVATLFKANGHQAQVLGGSSDHGIDILVLSDEKEKWIVQCKRYNGSVGEPVVRDLYGAMGHEGAQRAYLVTTGSFTTQAQEWAVGKPIVLYDGLALVKLIKSTKLHQSQLRL